MKMTDIIVVGAGPAGLTAAIYALRAGKSVLVLEKENFGGQVNYSPKIENYPGFTNISGSELADLLVEQALAQGAQLDLEQVQSGDNSDRRKAQAFERTGRGKVYRQRHFVLRSMRRRILLGPARLCYRRRKLGAPRGAAFG